MSHGLESLTLGHLEIAMQAASPSPFPWMPWAALRFGIARVEENLKWGALAKTLEHCSDDEGKQVHNPN